MLRLRTIAAATVCTGVASLSLASVSERNTSQCEAASGAISNIQTLKQELSSQLRTMMHKERTPFFPLSSVHVSNVEDNVVKVQFGLPHGDLTPVVSTALKSLQKAGHEITFHATREDSARSLSVVFPGGSAAFDGDARTCAFFKDDGLTLEEIDAVVQTYKAAHSVPPALRFATMEGGPYGAHPGQLQQQPTPGPGELQPHAAQEKLESMGLRVYMPDEGESNALNWGCLAGYDHVKSQIEDTIILALKYPERYDDIARQTRVRFESNRPKAILFAGPPGTGKTLSARIIASQAGKPMVHLPVERIVSKWYGESEKQLADVFDACDALEAIVFIDEIDAVAQARGGEMHEATRRMLSVLLQRLEGFDGQGKTTLVCATNRKEDLDAALMNRFDLILTFPLPDLATRVAVLSRYAKHLKLKELEQLAAISQGASCRDLKEACEAAERSYAAKAVRSNSKMEPPQLEEYTRAIHTRMSA